MVASRCSKLSVADAAFLVAGLLRVDLGNLAEESVECVIPASDGFVAGQLPVWLDAVLQAEELPTCISDLDTSLADVDAGCFPEFCELFDTGLADDNAELLLFDVSHSP